jgi:hypothetical protein
VRNSEAMSFGTVAGNAGRRPLLARTGLSSFVVLVWLAGCGRGSYSNAESGAGTADEGGSGGSSSSADQGGLSLSSAGTAIGIMIPKPCQLANTGEPVFAARALRSAAPARRELFTWTTAEQVQELRAGSVLLTRTEREGLGPGYAMEVLAELAARGETSDPLEADSRALARLLSGPAFSKARYAWSEPWATRVGWPGESYGDKLVRLVLRPDAWLARYSSGNVDVVDMNNAPVAATEVLAHPERLAGVYFVRDGGAGGPRCGGSFRGGDDGYREFIIGNESMIEEWSLGTPEIRARIESDIALVKEFFDRVRPCPPNQEAHDWNLSVVCSWSYGAEPVPTELGAYQGALAMPSPGYFPQPSALVVLIEALQKSLFEPDPFVVEPGP